MTKLNLILASTAAVIALSAPAFAADKTEVKAETTLEHSKNGGYDKTTTAEKSTPSGTVKDEAETKLKVSDDGDAEKTTTIEHSNDPKGLMNKHTTKSKIKEKTEDGKTTVEETKKVDGKTVVDTKATSHY